MNKVRQWLGRLGVHGVLWRNYHDWAVANVPFFLLPLLLCFMTVFFFFFAGSFRRAMVANLSVVFPDSPRAVIYLRALRSFYNYAWTIADGTAYKLKKQAFTYELVGAQFLDQLGHGQGAIVLTAHMGNYDLGAALFARRYNREIRMVRAPEPDEQSARHLSASLEKSGEGAVRVAYNVEGAQLSFELLDALKQGKIVSIQGDRAPENVTQTNGQLFGKTFSLPHGPFILALVGGVPIFPLFIVRSRYREYRIIVRNPIKLSRSGLSREDEIAPAVSAWCSVLEEMIRSYSSQWSAFTPVFRTNAKL